MEHKTANMVGKGTKDSTNRFHTYDGSIALETLKGMVILYSISIFDAYVYIRIYIIYIIYIYIDCWYGTCSPKNFLGLSTGYSILSEEYKIQDD